MDSTNKRKNTKWIVFGSIILVLAVLIAVGPVLVTKYMRGKWQDVPKYKTSDLLMKISGKFQVSADNTPYLAGSNGLFYVLENLPESAGNIKDNAGKDCNVLGRIRIPKKEETIDGNPVRLFVDVKKIGFAGFTASNNDENKKISEEAISNKIREKAKIRVEVNTMLQKPILFDVVKGKVASVKRNTLDGKETAVFVASDAFGDKYMLYKEGKDLSKLEGIEVICLGREILPPKNMPAVLDELTFEIYEVYDLSYNRLM